MFRPWQYDAAWRTTGGWYHVDQNAFNEGKAGRCCVQGLVSLCPADEGTGGLVVVPGSHRDFRGVCERNGPAPRPSGGALPDFVAVGAGDAVLAAGGRLVCAGPGDLLLWDSRTVHCNAPALAPAPRAPGGRGAAPPARGWAPIRMAGYVCMTPAAWAAPETLEERWRAFADHATTTHWPHFVGGSNRGPHGAARNDPAAVPERQRRLIGGPCAPPVWGPARPLTDQQREARRLMELAEAAERRGEGMEAVRLYKRAFKLDPDLDG